MKKVFLLSVITILAFSLKIFAGSETANNCRFTGNSSDYCYASNGTNNLKVLKCVPGTTDCNY